MKADSDNRTLQLKSPFEKGGFKNRQLEGMYGNRYNCETHH